MKSFFNIRYSLILGIAAMASACSSGSSEKHGVPTGTSVTVAAAVQKDIPIQIHTIGNVEAYSTVVVKTQVKGELSRVFFKEGQEVKRGDLLFMIDPRSYQASVRQFEANLAKDTAQMKKAEADAQRHEALFKSGVVSKEETDQYHTNLEALSAIVKADEASVANAKLQLGYCYIRSPINGRIGKLDLHQGNIAKDIDTVLATINQTKPVYVAFSLPEQELSVVRRYMAEKTLKVEAVVPGSGMKPVDGELVFINNEVNNLTGTVLLKAVFANEDESLWPKQFVDVILTITIQPDVVVIPSQAIQEGQDGQYVYVVKSNFTAEYRPVVIGASFNQETIIVKGLQPGEKVVTDGQFQITNGSKVEIKNNLESLAQNSSDIHNQKSDEREE